MPAWWGKKSSSSRKKEDRKPKDKPKSFDESLARNLAVGQLKDASSSPYASGSDSNGAVGKRGHPHPLPRPSVLSVLSMGPDHGSISSLSSSNSSEDPPDLTFAAHFRYADPTNTPRGRSVVSNGHGQQHSMDNGNLGSSSPFMEHPGLPDIPASPRSEFHGLSTPNGSTLCSPRASIDIEFKPRSRSPGPGLRGHVLPTSPLHQRACCFSQGSSIERQEDGKSECHPLPLPPGSPNSHTFRTNGTCESTHSLHSKWKKGKLLGRGTFGHVYVGFNSDNGQMCAIKEVRVISDDQNSKESLKQLNQEITLLSQLSHPNIVQYYGSELAQDTLSVYLEYVSGGSIHKLLQEYGPFREPVIQNYTAQILSGIAYLHERKTVHRDIKGANILVGPNGEVKLVDFGMAKHITSTSSVLSFKGSPYWMAPEVIMNFNGFNLAVDIWSLGCTILEMATSKPPWSRYEGVAAIFKIGNSKEIPEIPHHLSNDGKDFLRLCLRRDPSLRSTAAQLLEHPFVRDQATVRVARSNVNNGLLQSSADDSHALNTNRKNIPTRHGDYTRHSPGLLTTYRSDHIAMRVNLSLPVSPCSSPLRQIGPAHRSCFLSPPAFVVGLGSGDGQSSNLASLLETT